MWSDFAVGMHNYAKERIPKLVRYLQPPTCAGFQLAIQISQAFARGLRGFLPSSNAVGELVPYLVLVVGLVAVNVEEIPRHDPHMLKRATWFHPQSNGAWKSRG
jgi:hypothetical protein